MADWLVQAGVAVLAANIHPEHEASASVARSLGFRPTGAVVDGENRWELRS
jgi:L-amino acid N-acyltransferase YncA